MTVERHNWEQERRMFKCVESPVFIRVDGAGCRGCGAEVPIDGFVIGAEFSQRADLLWHEKYHPMAELACLIEEAAL